ncbi:MAG: lipopolysaccharide assembly protein LapA domain-containing protein [Burkholderiales bacterium]
MRAVSWILKIALFLLLFGFALKNTGMVAVHGYLGYEWQAPLILILLIFFALGIGIGLAAGAAAFFRQQRRIAELRRQLRTSDKTEQSTAVVKQV